MAPTLGFASMGMLGILLVIIIAFVVVLVRAIRVASGGGNARRESGGEAAMLSMALQDALVKLKQQERAMAARAEASERLADQIVEGLTSGLVVVDRGGQIQAINPAAKRILGIDGGAGKPYREALRPVQPLSGLIDEALEGSSPIVRRTIMIGSEKPRHLGVTISPIINDEGSLQASVCLFTDLTDVMQLEEQLRLKEALARLGELTAGLAHEFRNGLATIHGYGKLLDPQSLPPQAKTCVDGIRAETIALGEVVTNFLRFARPEQMTMTPVELKTVIQRAIDDVPGAAAAVELEGDFPAINGDDVLLRRAFSNLVRNSLEACADAGMPPHIYIRSDIPDDHAILTVEDNGPGFSPEYLSKVFQPFATTKANGTGLGLAIVQKVIVSHNGLIAAANRPEGGAQFRLRLPLASRDPGPLTPRSL
ncbi:MAG: PAS domain-containing protein [Cyanobacteria bacterium]|nr:PAS domain-containing protein [Cyanobacteriota bacterium]